MTAVEWFAQELYEKFEMKGDGKVFDELLDKAKEMEKEHLYNFYMQGGVDAITEADRNVEQCYNKTFKSE